MIIGNPPYNANQLNENEVNKNRKYPDVDKRIKDTYIAESTAQKTKLYDMYARFLRWASDRVDSNGIVAFISNSSFIDSRTFDGFRKVVAEEFNEIWIIDLKGNARTSGERRRREGGNIFSNQIRVGVAVYFCVKKQGSHGCRIFYEAVRDYAKSDEKREFLTSKPLAERAFVEVRPDAKHNWIDLTQNDFDTLMPIVSVRTKAAVRPSQEKAIFKLYSNGLVTARDEWMIDFNSEALARKVQYFCGVYLTEQARWRSSADHASDKDKEKRKERLRNFVSREIKWTEELEDHLDKGTKLVWNPAFVRDSSYRPFVGCKMYYAPVLTHRVYKQNSIFPIEEEWANIAIGFSGLGSTKPFEALSVGVAPSFDLLEKTQFARFQRYDSQGRKVDNITDWALNQFGTHYQQGRRVPDRPINKEAIFHYVYAVLHDSVYREKYAQNLKREFPRIPFYPDFWQWSDWGKALMDLHIGYESVAPWPLERIDIAMDRGEPVKQGRSKSLLIEAEAHKPSAKSKVDAPKAILKADKDGGRLILDTRTTLGGVPTEAWGYKLGNRCALEWILEEYKEQKPKDPTIRDRFNTYRFADYKEKVVDLLTRVTTVSVETQKIVEAMRTAPR